MSEVEAKRCCAKSFHRWFVNAGDDVECEHCGMVCSYASELLVELEMTHVMRAVDVADELVETLNEYYTGGMPPSIVLAIEAYRKAKE